MTPPQKPGAQHDLTALARAWDYAERVAGEDMPVSAGRLLDYDGRHVGYWADIGGVRECGPTIVEALGQAAALAAVRGGQE